MRGNLKLSRLVSGSGLWQTSFLATTRHYPRRIEGPHCLSCGLFHSAESSSSSTPLTNAETTRISFSRFAVVHRNFRSGGGGGRLSAGVKKETVTDDEAEEEEEEEEEGKQPVGKAAKAVEASVASESRTETTSKPERKATAADGEIGFVEGKIDEIKILDVREAAKTTTTTTREGAKKKSSDLRALEKFDIIVSGDGAGGDLAPATESPRTFQVADDDLSIMAPPAEALELRKKPIVELNYKLDPKTEPWLRGDRKNPPKFDFSLRENLFDEAAQMEGGKTKRAFGMAIEMFCKVDPKYRRGHVEMVYKAANLLKEYGLEKDLDGYKMIFNLFPKGVMIPKSSIQAGFFHYPRQQDTACDVLKEMWVHGVIPDQELGKTIREIFSRRSQPYRDYRKMIYWMPKFKYASPFPFIPLEIEKEDALTAAKMALERICVDLENEVTVHRVPRPEEEKSSPFASDFWIASGISPKQRELISRLPTDKPIYVKGPFPAWLRGRTVEHFVLWAELPDVLKEYYREVETEETFEDYIRQSKDIHELMESDITRQAYRGSKRKNVLAHRPSCHEQEDGIILALSVLEVFSKELLTSWIKYLESSNPHLSEVPVIFSLSSLPPSDLVVQPEDDSNSVALHR